MAEKSYGWDLGNVSKSSLNVTKKRPIVNFLHFSKTVYTIRTKTFTGILNHIRFLYVQLYQICIAGILETAGSSPEMTKKQPILEVFQNFFTCCPNGSNEISCSYSTPYWSTLCALASK